MTLKEYTIVMNTFTSIAREHTDGKTYVRYVRNETTGRNFQVCPVCGRYHENLSHYEGECGREDCRPNIVDRDVYRRYIEKEKMRSRTTQHTITEKEIEDE